MTEAPNPRTAADPAPSSGWEEWAVTVADVIAARNGTSREAQGWTVLKVMEEAGEAAAAWIGYVGQNPRKGVTHTLDDVAGELADVAATALVALATLGFDPRQVMTEHRARMQASRFAVYEAAAAVAR